jgi:HAE1 family hydrophobic/amphiphilic exporter-1
VATTLIMAGLLIFGLMAYKRLAVSDLPSVDFPTIQVSARLPGASPDTMASAVATPLERQFSTISGVTNMSSSNTLGSTRITLQFDLARDLDAAAQDVQSAIAATTSRLPKEMTSPPTYRKVNPASQPILYLALTSPTLPLYVLNDYGDNMLAQRISMVEGVAQVVVYGSQKYAVRVRLDPERLASLGLGLGEVTQAVQAANSHMPTGALDSPHRTYTLETSGQLEKAAEYRTIIVVYRNGRPIRLEDVAEVSDSVESEKSAAWFIDQRAMVLAVQRQPGANTVQVAEQVKKLLPTFEAALPASVSLRILFDRSESIRESVRDVQFTLLFTLGLVVLIIFIFLRKITATIIPSLAMPMSLVGTFGFMYLSGYSLNNLSLMALILCIGFVVDDAIVMLENIIRHVEMGESPLEAAYKGSKEVAFTIVSMTISLAAVFIPVLFMGGILGRLFTEFAVTIAVAVLVSGVVSIVLTPMLCSRFLARAHRMVPDRKDVTAPLRVYDRVLWGYGGILRWVLVHRRLALIFTLAILAGTIQLFQVLPKGFIPSEDTGQIMAFTEADQGISFDSMVRHQQALARIVQADPNVAVFMSAVGSGGPTGRTNSGTMFMRLVPRRERALTADQVVTVLRGKLSQEPGIRAFVQNPPALNLGGQFTRSLYQYSLQGTDLAELYRVAPLLEDRLKSLPLLMDVNSDLQVNNPQVHVQIDRDRASALGVTAAQIEDVLYTAYGARQITSIFAANDEYQVIAELGPGYQLDPSAPALLKVRSAQGNLIPLDGVAKLTTTVGPAAVNHLGQLPVVTISFNLRPGASLGPAVDQVQAAAREVLPQSITPSFQGTAQTFQSSMAGMTLLLLMAVVVIYLVLGILYESFIHPITILSALPFAGFGALATLFLFRAELNIYGFVGVIMLIGLVKKNGIMMIDFAIEARRSLGKSANEAILDACLVRFRPIMMTTMAALMGTLPIALGYGAGGEARRPLGLAVVGGLVFSQFLTLFVTPVFYSYLEGFREWLGLRRRARTEEKPMVHSKEA